MRVVPSRRPRSGLAVCVGALLWPALASAQAPPAPASPPASAPASKPVAGVTVQAAPEQSVRTSIDRRSYSVSSDLQGASGSLADALRNIPGAEVDLNGNLSLRGARVRIMIDGQPSALFSGQAAGLALQAMPADRIDRVEVITTPTAAFSPEGQGGIINLVTKKTAPAGTSGALRANLGSEGRANAAGSVAYVKGKLTVTADGGVRRDFQKVDSETTGTVADPVTGQADPRTGRTISNGPLDSWNGHIGFDYRIDPKTQLSGEARYNVFVQDRYNDSSLFSSTPAGAPLAAYTRLGALTTSQAFGSGQLSLRHQFPGQDHTLVLFFNHAQTNYRNEVPSTDLTTAPPPALTYFQDTFARTNTDTNEFKADYTRPMAGKAQLKTGYDFRVVNGVYNNFGVLGPSSDTAAIDPVFTNLFRYGQMTNAAYVTYEQPVRDFTVLGGLRVEAEHLALDALTQNQTIRRDEVGLFPTLHLAYDISPNNRWIFRYSSRLQRPQPFDLDPFRNVQDPYNIRMGNPDLKDQVTQSFETGWEYKKAQTSYIATLFYRQADRGVTNVVTDLGGGVLQTTKENLSNSKNAGLELIAAAPIGKTFNFNASTDLYWNQIQSPASGAPGAVLQSRQDFTASARASLNWRPTKIDLVQFNGVVNAAQQTPQGHTDPLVVMFLGYQHKFTDHFAVIGQMQDPFGLVHLNSYLDSDGLNEHTNTRVGFRAFYLGFTYTFGGSGRAQRDPGFDFNPGSAPAAAP